MDIRLASVVNDKKNQTKQNINAVESREAAEAAILLYMAVVLIGYWLVVAGRRRTKEQHTHQSHCYLYKQRPFVLCI
jgi:cbb3-type cytochrome oxidase subunit 3